MTFKGIAKLLNQQGFSLTEVMVGGAVLAGVALTASQLFKDQKFAQRGITDDQKLALFHGDLAKTMMDPKNCNATLKIHYNTPTTSGITPKPFDKLYKCTSTNPNDCEDDNTTSDGTTYGKSIDAYTVGKFPGTAFLQVGQGIETWSTTTTDKGVSWKIESMNIVGTRTKTGPVTLRIKYRNQFFPTKSISKDIIFNARFYGGYFKECLSSQIASVDNFNNDFCKTFNFKEVDTSGVMARWDESTQTCKFDGIKDCSTTPGMQADGIDTNGVVKCKPITTDTDAINLQKRTPISCPVGKIPKASFDISARVFKVDCI